MIKKEDFFNVSVKIVKLEGVPEIGKDVHVKTMTCFERDEYELLVMSANGKAGARARMAMCTVCDAKGNLLFGEKDYEKVKGIPAHVMQPIWNMAAELNSFDEDDVNTIIKN